MTVLCSVPNRRCCSRTCAVVGELSRMGHPVFGRLVPGITDHDIGNTTDSHFRSLIPEGLLAKEEELRKKTRVIANAVKDWLARAKNCPLRVALADFGAKEFYPNHTNTFCTMLIDVLIHFFKQIGQLFLSLPPDRPGLQHVLSLSRHFFPKLTVLDIYFRERGHQPALYDNVQAWQNSPIFMSPALRRIRVYYPQSLDAYSLPVAWGHLTHLSLEHITDSEGFNKAIKILRSCHSNLISFHFSGSAHSILHSVDLFDAGVSVGHFVLPFLKTLSFDLPARLRPAPAVQGAKSVFEQFDFPALECLHYFWFPQSYLEEREATSVAFYRIIQRWGQSLKRLETTPQSFSAGDIRFYLRECPDLQEFVLGWSGQLCPTTTVIGPESNDTFLEFLGSTDKDGHFLLPKFQIFENINQNRYTDNAILNFIRAKQTAGPGLKKLRKISLKMYRSQQEAMAEALRSFIEDDCGVELEYSEKVTDICQWLQYPPIPDITSPDHHLPVLCSSYPSEKSTTSFIHHN
ncbi:hypothetical protein CPB83DRAFT_852515 [Crepidotus variabilis]|uniref:Uncharacterized protein n=1 Tax=Crepidotus variabilis TaxID=179855 RepID=A0A9P6JQ86_9AGAR|nr:hypothetical protein CPB83DRAFT_852515 [Crepidotus variabilis]